MSQLQAKPQQKRKTKHMKTTTQNPPAKSTTTIKAEIETLKELRAHLDWRIAEAEAELANALHFWNDDEGSW
jgi:hypothetical protein